MPFNRRASFLYLLQHLQVIQDGKHQADQNVQIHQTANDPDDFNAVAEALGAKGYTFASAQIEMVPQNYQKLETEEQVKLMEKLLEIMEDDDDVQNVWHNWEQE